MKLALYIFWLIFAVVAILSVLQVRRTLRRRAGAISGWPRVRATVIDNAPGWSSTIGGDTHSTRLFYPVYRFTGPDEAPHEGRSEVGTTAPAAIGSELDVAYNPLNPDQSFHQTALVRGTAVAASAIIGGLLVLALVVIAWLPLPFGFEPASGRHVDLISMVFIVLPGMFLAVGLLLVLIGLLTCVFRWFRVRNWVRTAGIVTGRGAPASQLDGTPGGRFFPEYHYLDAAGGAYTGRADVPTREEPIIGQRIEIAYDPADPRRSAIPVFFTARGLLGVALIVSFFGAAGVTMFTFVLFG